MPIVQGVNLSYYIIVVFVVAAVVVMQIVLIITIFISFISFTTEECVCFAGGHTQGCPGPVAGVPTGVGGTVHQAAVRPSHRPATTHTPTGSQVSQTSQDGETGVRKF